MVPTIRHFLKCFEYIKLLCYFSEELIQTYINTSLVKMFVCSSDDSMFSLWKTPSKKPFYAKNANLAGKCQFYCKCISESKENSRELQ